LFDAGARGGPCYLAQTESRETGGFGGGVCQGVRIEARAASVKSRQTVQRGLHQFDTGCFAGFKGTAQLCDRGIDEVKCHV